MHLASDMDSASLIVNTNSLISRDEVINQISDMQSRLQGIKDGLENTRCVPVNP
jgi:hypothetical protein